MCLHTIRLPNLGLAQRLGVPARPMRREKSGLGKAESRHYLSLSAIFADQSLNCFLCSAVRRAGG